VAADRTLNLHHLIHHHTTRRALGKTGRSHTVHQNGVAVSLWLLLSVYVVAAVAVAIASATQQIPLHLCKSLVRAVRHFGSSSSCCLASDDGLTTTWDHKIENMLRFTSIALMLLTNNAIKLAARQAASESCGSAAAGVPERVTAGFVQQLERSEMLLSLPEMLDMAAETLTRYSFQVCVTAPTTKPAASGALLALLLTPLLLHLSHRFIYHSVHPISVQAA